ncbi:MAG: sulfatase family protein [Oceanipulchritudo sp.]
MTTPIHGPHAARRPHLVFIFSDQQHHAAWGRRDPFFATPHMDRLAADALDCTRAYCTTPLCSPSRSSLMTGRFPHQTGVIKNGIHLKGTTLAPRLQAAGYTTAYFGKWHLGGEPQAVAGWDEMQGVHDEYKAPNRPLSDAETRDFACDFLARHAGDEKPFALFVSFDEPHGHYVFDPNAGYPAGHAPVPEQPDPATPLPHSTEHPSRVPALWCDSDNQGKDMQSIYGDDATWRYQVYRKVYRDRVAAYDRSLGAVLDQLRRLGLYDDCLVIVGSDHGDMDAAQRTVFKGHYNYDAVQRVPLLLKAPAAWNATARAYHGIVSLVDVPATLLDAAGVPADSALPGHSLLPVLRGQAPGHGRDEAVVAYVNRNDLLTSRTLVHADWKYVKVSDGREALIHLPTDPAESRDLAADPAHAATLDGMRQRLRTWCRRENDTAFLPCL